MISQDRLNQMLAEERESERARVEEAVRERFKHIIGGKGFLIPRIAVKLALDSVFKKLAEEKHR